MQRVQWTRLRTRSIQLRVGPLLNDDRFCMLIGLTHTLLACHEKKNFIPSRTSPSQKRNKSSRRVLTFSRSRRNLISVLSSGILILSTRRVFASVLFITVLLVHIRMPKRVMKHSSCFHLYKKTFLL